MDLIEFLTARLDEDERVARATRPEYIVLGPFAHQSDAAHALRHDPARVLREVEAKRRILDAHQPSERLEYGAPLCSRCTDLYPCDTVLLLALPYSDHRDYRDEWWP